MSELTPSPEPVALPMTIERRQRRTRLWIAVYSIVLCAGTFSTFNGHAAVPFMGSRENDVTASIDVLDRGGPPLLASDVPYHAGISVTHLRPVGVTDDQGIYVYLPALEQLTGEHDPATLMKWLFMGCFALLALVYPLIFYELFGSAVVAVAAPLLALWKFSYTQPLDLYWILAWCMLLGIPGLVLAYSWWPTRRRAASILLVALMIAASFSTSIRIHSGLPILIVALGVVLLVGVERHGFRARLRRFWTLPRWWVRPAIAAGLALAYLSIGTFGMALVRDYRNHVIHEPNFGSTWPSQHPFWHNAYIGLGYLPNPYGIEWSDTVSADAVERAHPGTGYLTATYESTLRHLYVDIAKNDPGFVLRTFWTKTRVLVADGVSSFWAVIGLLPLAMLIGRRRHLMRVALLVAIPAAVLGALAPVLTIPWIKYELAWLGTWGALWILVLAWAWVTLRDAAAAEVPPDLAPLRERPDPDALRSLSQRLRREPATWATATAVIVAAVLASVARPAPPPSSAGLYSTEQGSFIDNSWLDRTAVAASWTFPGKLAPDWKSASNTFLQRDSGGIGVPGLYIRSPQTIGQEQLVSPTVMLTPGSYALLASGRSLVGGFSISVVDDTGGALGTADYSSQQSDFLTKAMWMPITVTTPTRVHVSVASWSSVANASSWILWKVALVRNDVIGAAKEAAPDHAFYVGHAALLGQPTTETALNEWSFANGMTPDWGPVASPQLGIENGSMTVTTSARATESQVWSPPLTLSPGPYEFDVQGVIRAGGMRIGALDVDRNRWLGEAGYWAGQHFRGRVMRVRFVVRRPSAVRLVLANWGRSDHVSMWSIQSATLYHGH